MPLAAHGRMALVITAVLVVAGCSVADTTIPRPTTTVPPSDPSPVGDESTTSPTTVFRPTTTVAAPDPSSVGDVLVIGDWGSGTSAQDQVAQEMANYTSGREISAILTTGDNFYSDAADELMEPYDWARERDIPFIIAWGNHDVETGSRIEAVEATFNDPPRWVSHSWGAVDIVILDSNTVESPEQLDFLERTLRSSTDPTIVVFHHPPYNCGRHRPSREVVEHWVSRFDEDIVLVLSGHDHNYQRFESSGVAYVVSGGGGRRQYELSECPPGHPDLVVGATTHHFLVIEQHDEIQITAIDVEGRVIDDFSIELP